MSNDPKPTVGRVVHFYSRGRGPFAATVTCTNHPNDPKDEDIVCLDVSLPPCDQALAEGPVAEVPRAEPMTACVSDGRGGVTGPEKCWVWPPRA